MDKYKKLGVAIAGIAVLCLGIYFLLEPKIAVDIPNLSRRSGEINPSSEFLNAQKAVEHYRDEIRKHPDAVKNYIELAQLFLQEARVTGNDVEYLPKARSLLEEALRRDPESFDAIITKASMSLTMHQFLEAKQLLEKAIARNPHNAFAYGVLCDAHVELGEYDEAVKASDKMISIRPDLRSYSRVSYLRELHGGLKGAREAMKLACDAGVHGQENRAWALYYLGKLFLEEGKLDTAAYIFNGILEERPNYAYALSGLAQVMGAQGGYDEAIRLLERAYKATPEHLFLEQLADIHRATGQFQSADSVIKKILDTFEQDEQRGWNINREYAMLCANHEHNLPEALERAKTEYDRRPNNIDVLDTYAWALYKNGKASEAVPFVERAMRLNTESSALHYRAGMIYYAAGQREKGFAYLKRSLNENPFVHVLYVDSARKMISSLRNPSLTNK